MNGLNYGIDCFVSWEFRDEDLNEVEEVSGLNEIEDF